MNATVQRMFGSRGTVFDIAMLAGNLWIAPRLAEISRVERGETPAFGVLLLFCILLYCLGAWLKREPLHARLADSAGPPTPLWAWITLFVLMIMQGAFFVGCFMLGAEQVAAGLFPGVTLPGAKLLLPVGVGITLTVPVWLTIRALMPPRRSAVAPATFARRELLADVALYATALIALAWWDGTFVPELSRADMHGWFMSILFIVLVTVPFAIFYAAPRVLFLAEDYRKWSTWLRMAAVMAPLAVRVVMK